jgi:histone deacetylase 1/2
VRSSNMENANSCEYLEKIKNNVIENLRRTAPVPSVQMQDIPRASMGMTDDQEDEMDDLDEDENRDARMTQRQWEKKVSRHDEFEDSDDEDMAEANGVYKPNGQPRRSILDFPNPHAAPEDEMEVDSGVATPVPKPAEAAAETAADNDDTVLEDADPQPAAPETDEATEAAPAAPAPAPAPIDKDGDVDMDDAEDKAPEATIKTEEVEGAAVADPARKQTPLEGLLSALNDADPAKDAEEPATADTKTTTKDSGEVADGAEGSKAKAASSEPEKVETAPST